MIARAAMVAGGLALALVGGGTARADVMEIAADGTARWVSGPRAMAEPAPGARDRAGAADGETPGPAPEHLPHQAPDLVPDLVPEAAITRPETSVHAIPARYEEAVRTLAARYDLSPSLIEALVWQESRWQARALSPAGARGLAQLMPATARELGVDADNPLANLAGGARYLREQIDRFDGDLEKALAAYNAGPSRVMAAGGIPAIRETRTYVRAIMDRLARHSLSP